MSLTTNGIGLRRTATALKAAGLDRVNVSLDTLRPDVFKTLTRRDRHKDVIEGLHAARDAGLTPVEVNTVLMPRLNEDEAPDLLAWAVEHDYKPDGEATLSTAVGTKGDASQRQSQG